MHAVSVVLAVCCHATMALAEPSGDTQLQSEEDVGRGLDNMEETHRSNRRRLCVCDAMAHKFVE